MAIVNPFIIKGYVSSDYFCNRVQETDFLKESIMNDRNVVLFSHRRFGKTGLIYHLNKQLKGEKIKFIYCDIMMANSIRDFTYYFGKAVINQGLSLKQKSLNTISSLFSSFSPAIITEPMTGQIAFELRNNRSDFSISDTDHLFEFLQNSNQKFIIAFDEFQQILNFQEKGIEAYLRSKIQFLQNCTFIFSGSRKGMLLSMFNDASRPFWQSSAFLELKAIEKSIYFDFIRTKFSSGRKTITDEALNKIYELSKSITFFIQLLCHKLFYLRSSTIDIQKVVSTFSEIVKENEDFYLNYIQLFTKSQLDVLKAIACEDGAEKITSNDFIKTYNLNAASSVKSAIDKLIEKDVLYHENNKYRISDILFSNWLKNNTIR